MRPVAGSRWAGSTTAPARSGFAASTPVSTTATVTPWPVETGQASGVWVATRDHWTSLRSPEAYATRPTGRGTGDGDPAAGAAGTTSTMAASGRGATARRRERIDILLVRPPNDLDDGDVAPPGAERGTA